MDKSGGKFVLEWEKHSKHVSKGLCVLMEKQCLVDVAICCGSNTLHAHKCVLAANSSYFKDHFDNRGIEQVIINGLDFGVMKALIEFMYSGECVFAEELLKHLIAAAKFFKISALETVFSESEYQNILADDVSIPPPQFICKPPKYPTVYKPFNSAPLPPKINYALNNAFNQHKFKRKSLGSEAEKACAKEAQASRIALANLRKVMASTPQVHSFIVEESFNETTVENFIPIVEENFDNVDIQFVTETDPQPTETKLNVIPVSLSSNNNDLTSDKIKHILGNDQVEIMFQTSDGNYVNVSDEVLLNLTKTGLQYQVVDANGHIGELQELKSLDNANDKRAGIFQKRNDNFIKIPDVDAVNKEISEEFMDPNFSAKTMESIHLQPNFNEDLYMQNSGIFEPENLSLHSDLMADHPMEFESVNDLKYNCLASKMNALKHNLDESACFKKGIIGEDLIVNTEDPLRPDEEVMLEPIPTKPTLKFSPDMFFTEPPTQRQQNANLCDDLS